MSLEKVKNEQYEVSIIVPMRSFASQLPETIESIFLQEKVSFEVVFVDAGSSDRTVEIVKPLLDHPHVQLILLPYATDVEMIETGIKKASGKYIQVLFPGSSYLLLDALFQIMQIVSSAQFPDLFYTASFLRYEDCKQKFHFLPLREELLRLGELPTSLECSWFKKRIFEKEVSIEKKGELTQKALALELFIQVFKAKNLVVQSEMRVFVDGRREEENWGGLFSDYKEVARLLKKYFGFSWAFYWLLKRENLIRLAVYIKRKVELAFQKK